MLLIGFRGTEIHDAHPIVRDIRDHHLGGVVLFDYDVKLRQPRRNIESPEQLRRLTAALQAETEIPLWIAIDQEGGKVTRLKEACGFPPTSAARELGCHNQRELTIEHAERTAQTLAAAGINVNFAPVLDLELNPANPVIGALGRSFSENAATVVRHAQAWIEQHHASGIACAVKHFPGHGSSRDDSHQGWVDVTDVWSPDELSPYRTLIPSGLCDMIMTAHIFHAHLDPDWPATLSHAVITGILREQLHYDGVVVSDDLQMQAISGRYPLETILQQAIEAGVDILMFGNNVSYDADIVPKVMATLSRLVAAGAIDRDRIEQSYQRIIRLKQRFSLVGAAIQPHDAV